MTTNSDGTPKTSPAKAGVALVLAFVGALVASVTGREELDTLGPLEWLIIVATAVVTAGGVYGVENKPVR